MDWPLGSGASGTVYRCHRPGAPGAAAALKLLGGTPSTEVRRRFAREVEVLRRLDHPSLVKLVDAGEVAGRPYLVSGLARGRSLASLVSSPPVDPALACHVAGQLADALAHAHAHGIAHRDVKPSNALVDSDGSVTLIDFGIAAEADGSRITRASGRTPATPPYAPPEWWAGATLDGPAADVYALGLVLLELLVGANPFANLLPHEIAARKALGPLEADRGPEAARDLVRRCTSVDPAERPTAAEVAARLPRLPPDALPATPTLDTLPATDGPEPLPVEPIGGHRLVAVLGQGGMGVVYRAEPVEGGPAVALKWLRHPVPEGSEQERRFQREFGALSRLDHPGVVRVFGSGRHQGRPWYTMELVDGPDLATWLRERGPVEPERAIELGIEVGGALAHVHAAGLVHRDVKPANVLLERGVRPRIADFGLAQDATGTVGLTREGAVLGTPAYMAPEQARGEEAGPAVDVYALGVVLYELLCGQRPVDGRAPLQVLHRLEQGDVPRLDTRIAGLPAELVRVVHQAMALEREDRYPGMEALVADLERVRAGRTALARDPSLAVRVARGLRRRKTAVLAAGLSFAVGAAAVGGTWGARELSARWADAGRQATAAARLEALRPTWEGLDPDAGRATVQAFVDRPEHRGTRAQAQAWLAWAERLDDPEQRLQASALAWGAVVHPDEERAALGALAAALGETERWDGLGNVLGALDALPGGAPTALTARWAYGRRDLAQGRATDPRPGIGPLLDALGHAAPLDGRVDLVGEVDVDGDGQRELVILEGGELRVAERGAPNERRGLGLPGGIAEVGEAGVHEVAGRPLLRVRRGERVTAYALGGAVPVEVHHWDDGSIKATAVGDLDGNGRDELLLGSNGPPRHLVALEPREDGTWRFFEPHPASNAQNSGFQMLGFDDLDRDGTREFVQVRGAFGAYDVRVLAPGTADTEPHLLSRRKLGDTQHGELVRGPDDHRRIAVIRLDRWANRSVLPADAPFGEQPEGVWVLDWDGAALRTGWTRATTRPCDYVRTGDFDGDGLGDLAVSCQTDCLLARQLPDGGFVDVVLRDTVIRGVTDLDLDGDDEVAVEDLRTHRVWALGTGADALPVLPHEGRPLPTGVSATERAAALVEFGLAEAGARAWEDLARQSPDAGEAAAMRLSAGLAWEAAGEPQRAADAFQAAAAVERVQVEALDGAARTLQAVQRLPEARDALERLLLVAPDRHEAVLARLAPLRRHLDAPSVVLDFAAGLPEAVDVVDPVQAWHDPAAGVLRIQQVDGGVLARVPLELTGDGLGIEVQLAALRLEWGASLSVAVVPVDQPDHTGLGGLVQGMGGGGNHFTQVKCTYGPPPRRAPQWFEPRNRPDDRVDLALRSGVLPGLVGPSCAWEGLGRPRTGVLEPTAEPLGRHDLVIRALDRWGNGLADVAIARVVVRGARVVTGPPDPQAAARRALATQRPELALDALATLPEGPDRTLLELLARSDLGEDHRAARLLASLARDGALAKRGEALLRTRGDRLAPAFAEAVGPGWPDTLWSAWNVVVNHHPDDPHWRDRIARDLGPTEGRIASASLVRLLVARSRASQEGGRLGAAETDARRALEVAEALGSRPEEVEAGLQLARTAAARGQDEVALELVSRALDRADAAEVLADGLLLEPTFASLHALPGWSRVTDARAINPAPGDDPR